MRKLRSAIPLLAILILAGCHKSVTVHPGAVSNLDSYAYDVLLIEQDVITTAKAQFQSDQLPPAAKDPINYAISQYNVTQAAWQAYHAGGGDASKLQQALASLVAAVGELQKIIRPTIKPDQIPDGHLPGVPIGELQTNVLQGAK